jgi:hypothetical protein
MSTLQVFYPTMRVKQLERILQNLLVTFYEVISEITLALYGIWVNSYSLPKTAVDDQGDLDFLFAGQGVN